MSHERTALPHGADVPHPEGGSRHLLLPALPADLDTPERRPRPVLDSHATEALKEDDMPATCLVSDGDCVRGRIRRDLCDRHYGWLMRYGTTSRERRPVTRFVNSRPNAHGEADELLLKACRLGKEPAEALPRYARDWLVTDLVAEGWTDVEIACWTRMSTYTTARIRTRLGLAANRPKGAAA